MGAISKDMEISKENIALGKKIMRGMKESNKKLYESLSKIDESVVIMQNGKIKKVKAKMLLKKYS